MKLYRPIKYELAEKLAYAVKVGCGAVHAGQLVTDREAYSMKMLDSLGACILLELTSDFYKHAFGIWYELVKEAPISALLCKDVEQILVDTAERKLLGLPEPIDQAAYRPIVQTLAPVAYRPDEKALKDFRTTHGRAPNNEELRTMSKMRL